MRKINLEIARANIKLDNNSLLHKNIMSGESHDSDKKEQADYIVDLSNEGKLKANSKAKYKKANTNSVRESWENHTAEIKKGKQLNGPYADYDELFRLDDPESYSRFIELEKKKMEALTFTSNGLTDYAVANSWDDLPKEAQEYELEADKIFGEWFNRRCRNSNTNPAQSVIDEIEYLENRYSDKIHLVSFNLYGGNNSINENIWRFNSKYSVLLSKNIFNILGQKDDTAKAFLSFLDSSVNEMKNIDYQYEGRLNWLRFGIKLYDDWSITYHANYEECENQDGISANSPEELLAMLKKANDDLK